MARPALALVHHHVPGLSRRAAAATAGVVAMAALAYVAARTTPLFAIRAVEVAGAPAPVAATVRDALRPLRGTSLVTLDGAALARRLEALPAVRSIRYDRAFPHTLRVFVDPERPLAVVRRGRTWWLLSERGRLIRQVERRTAARYPRIAPPPRGALTLGGALSGERFRLALRALARPEARSLPLRIVAARVANGRIALSLHGGVKLRLADPARLSLKLAVAARVLRSLPREERTALAYVDLSLPERPVSAAKSQVVS